MTFEYIKHLTLPLKTRPRKLIRIMWAISSSLIKLYNIGRLVRASEDHWWHINFSRFLLHEFTRSRVQVREFKISSSRIHYFSFMYLRFHHFNFTNSIFHVQKSTKSKNLIHEIEIVHSCRWNREFLKLKDQNREITNSWRCSAEIANSRSWNHEFENLKSRIHTIGVIKSWSWNFTTGLTYKAIGSFSTIRKPVVLRSRMSSSLTINQISLLKSTFMRLIKKFNRGHG